MTHTEFPVAVDQPERMLTPRECVCNSLNVAMDEPGLSYAEGVAKRHGWWFCHAWNVNELGEVVDYTWGDPPGTRYLGRVIPTPEKMAAVVREKTWHFDMAGMPYVPDGEMGLDCLSREQAEAFRQLAQMEETRRQDT